MRFVALIIYISSVLLLTSCEKVIQLDVPSGEEHIVIEGIIEHNSVAWVKVSRSLPYDAVLENHLIEDAIVTIEKDNERSEILHLVKPGYYKTSRIYGKINSSYKLTVEYEGETYVAESTMPNVTPIDSIYYTYDPFPEVFEIPGDYRVDIDFKDPADITNYYRLKGYINGDLLNGTDEFMVFDDKFFDGNLFATGLVLSRFNINDVISYDLISIDKQTYNYYNQLQDIMGGNRGGSGIPYNPEGNFSNGAFGYFSAQSNSIASVTIEATKQ